MKTWRLIFVPIILATAFLSIKVFLVLAGAPSVIQPAPDQTTAALEIQANYASDWVAGVTDAWATVVVTVTDQTGAYKEGAVVTANEAGDFFVACEDWWAGWCPDIRPGDGVLVWAAGLAGEIDPVGAISGLLDKAENTVNGVLEVEGYAGTLNVSCEVWADPGPEPIYLTVNADGGEFQCDFTGSWDLEPGDLVALRYYEPDGDQVINHPIWPWARVNYAHDWVGVDYEVGHTFWITVTDDLGNVKATASAETVYDGGWGGPGFNLDHGWAPDAPDITPFDMVQFTADTGYTNTIKVGQIHGLLNLAADLVSGTLNVPWFDPALPLTVECHPWGAWDAGVGDAPVKQSSALPDGSDQFNCDWGSGGEWDILPGQDVAAMYIEPDQDRVIDVYREPAPYLGVALHAQGDATPDGNYQFQIEYWNQGDAPAENVMITDTLPPGLDYLSDTSGFPFTGIGSDEIVWDLGTVDPGVRAAFELFVEVSAAEGVTVTNTTLIATGTAFDQGEPWEKTADRVVAISGNDTRLGVEKWAWTGDPVPGEQFVFELDVCNQGSTASSLVTMTDTFPAETELVTWWSLSPGWSEEDSIPGTLELTIPTIPGFACRGANLIAELDASLEVGSILTNTANIAADNDLETNDNEAVWRGHVGEPFINLQIDKWWNGGRLTPGGELRYGIEYRNAGNIPVGGFRITETLPAGTSFISAWHEDLGGGYPFPPDLITGEYVVWEFPGLPNGYSGQFEVRLAVDPAAIPDSPLINQVDISPLPGEATYHDNQATWLEVLYPPGPNLRVNKRHSWEDDSRLNYEVQFENIGDEIVSNVWITDTLPLGTHWSGSYGLTLEGERLITFDYIDGTRTLLWLLDELQPGENGRLQFGADLDGPWAPALWFTNIVEISPLDGDVNPADNFDEDVAFSGGELERVGFWLAPYGSSSIWGTAVPGSVITVTTPLITANSWADPACDGCWVIEDAGLLLPGDPVIVEAGEGLLPVELIIPEPFFAEVNTSTGIVAGQIGGWFERPVEVFGYWPEGYREVNSDGAGNFDATYESIPPGSSGYVQIVDQVNYAEVIFQRPFQALDLLLTVNYGHDWVEGLYEPDHTVWITATDSGSSVKGQAELWSTEIPWWEGETGFSTLLEGWVGDPPDLQPGDWILGKVDNGFEAAVRLGEIEIQADPGLDLVSGTVLVEGPEIMLPLRCEIWEAPDAPVIHTEVGSAGGLYSCDFGGAGWDLQPYQMVAVIYTDPAGHQVINMLKWPHLAALTGPLSDGDRHVWGDGNTPGATISVTVTTDLGEYIAGTVVQADLSGTFDTGDSLPPGSLASWNEVTVDFGSGMTETLVIYPLNGLANPATDVVTITAAGPEFFSLGLEYCLGGECGWIDLGEIGPSGVVVSNLMAEHEIDILPEATFHAHLFTWNRHEVVYSWDLPRLYLPLIAR